MKRGLTVLFGASLGLGLGLGLVPGMGAPATAQVRTDGAKFLEAVRERDGDSVMAMLGQPGNTLINSRDIGTGEGPLHIVTARRDIAWVRFLLQRGANPNAADRRGTTPLRIAAQIGFLDGVEALAKGGAQVDTPDSTGETPLIAAVHRRDIEMVRLLLERGASPQRTDNSGRSARDYAALLANGAALLDVFDKAAREKDAKAQQYGPN